MPSQKMWNRCARLVGVGGNVAVRLALSRRMGQRRNRVIIGHGHFNVLITICSNYTLALLAWSTCVSSPAAVAEAALTVREASPRKARSY